MCSVRKKEIIFQIYSKQLTKKSKEKVCKFVYIYIIELFAEKNKTVFPLTVFKINKRYTYYSGNLARSNNSEIIHNNSECEKYSNKHIGRHARSAIHSISFVENTCIHELYFIFAKVSNI